jgi:hypothetical protein
MRILPNVSTPIFLTVLPPNQESALSAGEERAVERKSSNSSPNAQTHLGGSQKLN